MFTCLKVKPSYSQLASYCELYTFSLKNVVSQELGWFYYCDWLISMLLDSRSLDLWKRLLLKFHHYDVHLSSSLFRYIFKYFQGKTIMWQYPQISFSHPQIAVHLGLSTFKRTVFHPKYKKYPWPLSAHLASKKVTGNAHSLPLGDPKAFLIPLRSFHRAYCYYTCSICTNIILSPIFHLF